MVRHPVTTREISLILLIRFPLWSDFFPLNFMTLRFRLLIFLSFICLIQGASQTPSVANPDCAINGVRNPAASKESSQAIKTANPYPIFFVTNRDQVEKSGHPVFNSNRSSTLRYGMMPPTASRAKSTHVDPATITMFDSKQDFLKALQATRSSRVAVFVHGYRKSFDGSLSFGQNLGANLQIPVVVFAWPSKNKYSSYMSDECTAEWSSFPLAKTFSDLGRTFGNKNVNIISHSLGARMVAWSLRILASEDRQQDKFGSVVFCSPDFDRDTFMAETPMIKSSCNNAKIYLDSHDTRIWLSKVLHGNPRLGTMDNSKESLAMMQVFDCDLSLPSHHIPFPLLTGGLKKESSLDEVDVRAISNFVGKSPESSQQN